MYLKCDLVQLMCTIWHSMNSCRQTTDTMNTVYLFVLINIAIHDEYYYSCYGHYSTNRTLEWWVQNEMRKRKFCQPWMVNQFQFINIALNSMLLNNFKCHSAFIREVYSLMLLIWHFIPHTRHFILLRYNSIFIRAFHV